MNEENASGGRVVTAPTNGAAGIIPAVGHYYLRFVPGADAAGIRRYLLTAAAIALARQEERLDLGRGGRMPGRGRLGLRDGRRRALRRARRHARARSRTPPRSPWSTTSASPATRSRGLVQVPCIERNAIASSTAVSAARLALHGDGTHLVSLDMVIETMRQTGIDMMTKYKETSEGGLAVNVIEC